MVRKSPLASWTRGISITPTGAKECQHSRSPLPSSLSDSGFSLIGGIVPKPSAWVVSIVDGGPAPA